MQQSRYKLEKYKVIKTIGEMNGSPLSIEFHSNTALWNQVIEQAREGIDSFGYVSDMLGIHISEIIGHLYEQDLNNNIKKLPATKRDVYFEVLKLNIDVEIAEKIVTEINAEVEFRLGQLDELKELFSSSNYKEVLHKTLN